MARRDGFMRQAARAAKTLLDAQLVPKPLERVARALSTYGGYDAAKPARQRASWPTANPGPNTSTAAGAPNLIARSRDLERNDAHWARFLELFADEVVGTGIVPRASEAAAADPSRANGPRARTQAEVDADAAWTWFVRYGDLEGRHTLYQRTWTAARAWARDGSVFIRRIWDASPGRVVPIAVQVFERDQLDTSKVVSLPTGGKIVNGIQVGPTGRVEGYHFFREHPGEQIWGFGAYIGETVFVPASEIIHLYTPTRAGQLDGVPHGAPSMARKRDLSQFQSNEVMRKATESCVVGVATPPPLSEVLSTPARDDWAVIPSVLNSQGDLVGDLKAGAILTVENGGNMAFLQPHVVANYAEYVKTELHEIAAGLQTPYEDLTGDLEGVNYTSYRAGHLKRHAHVDVLQWLTFIPEVMDRLWDWCQEAAWLAGTVGTPDMPREWATPKRFSVDPEKDAIADIIEERAGYALHDDGIARRGYDPKTFYERRAAEKSEQDRWKLIFDTDPSQMAFRGAFPAQTQGTSLDPSALKAALSGLTEEQRDAVLREVVLRLLAPPSPRLGGSAEPGS